MKLKNISGLIVLVLWIATSCDQPKEKINAEKIVKVMSTINTDRTKKEMSPTKEKIDTFFTAYEKMYNDALTSGKVDVYGTADFFADCFIESNPVNVTCGKNDREFKNTIKQGYAFYKSIGTTSIKILNKEIKVLNENHAMVTVHWESTTTKQDNTDVKIKFNVIYLLQIIKEQVRIFAYIAEDEQKAYKEKGIEPYKQ